MKPNTTKKITFTALFTAIICVATVVPKIPIAPTNGYIHLGDAFVILSSLFLGPVLGTLASGMGACLADIIGGYMIYAPVTLVVKGIMSFSVWIIYEKLTLPGRSESRQKTEPLKFFIAAIVAALINVAGYFGFEWMLYGSTALLGIPGNLIQGISGVVISAFCYPFMKKSVVLLGNLTE